MKSISFDQLKTMLKSMSYPIFTRIGRAEKNVQSLVERVSDLKTQIPAKPKKIIFRQNSSNEYTCDLTFNDLWETEPEQIASNTILIDRYGVEKAARSARKRGSVEYGYRNIQIDIDDSFEADMYTYFKPTYIIDWWANAYTATINVHTASSLSNQKIGAVDVPNVPIFRAGNWGNYAIGPGLKVDEVAATPTLEINAGEGLEFVDGVLKVKGVNAVNAGKLLFVNENGTLSPLSLGTGLKIVDGVLTIEASIAKAVAGMALAGQVNVGEV